MRECCVDGAFRKPGGVGDGAHTGADGAAIISCRLAVQMQINEIGGWFLIVADQITHQNIEHVIVDGNALFEAGHREKHEGRSKKDEVNSVVLYR